MRRLDEQHRGGAPRSRAQRRARRHRVATTICAAVATIVVWSGGPFAHAAGSSCADKPGAKNQGAAAQYCPKEAPRPSESEATPGSGPGSTGAVVGTPSSNRGGTQTVDPGTGTQIPLLDYPSTGGLNALIAVLLLSSAVLAALGGRRFLLRRSGGASELH